MQFEVILQYYVHVNLKGQKAYSTQLNPNGEIIKAESGQSTKECLSPPEAEVEPRDLAYEHFKKLDAGEEARCRWHINERCWIKGRT